MIQVGWNDQKTGILFADYKLIQRSEGGRSFPAIEDRNFHQPTYDKETVGSELMKAPRADAPGKGRGYVNLNDRRPQNLPACACYFSDVPVLVWNRPAGAENHALDRLITQISRLIDSRLFPQQLVGADHIWCHGLNVAISASARNSFCVVGTKAAVNVISESWVDDCLYSLITSHYATTEFFAFAKVPTPARQSGRLNLSCSSCQ